MASLDTSRTIYRSINAVSSIGAFIQDMVATVSSWNDARVTRSALSGLTDRELEDIGLIRGDIDSVAVSTLIR